MKRPQRQRPRQNTDRDEQHTAGAHHRNRMPPGEGEEPEHARVTPTAAAMNGMPSPTA